MGGAIGVAVFGSLMSSHFTGAMTDTLGGSLPTDLAAQVSDTVGQAIGVASNAPIPSELAGQIVDAAKDSFVGGLHVVALVAAGVTLTGAILVAKFLPARARDDDAGSDHQPADADALPVA
jgi:DHA2 family integral membrane protein (MFS transporter)